MKSKGYLLIVCSLLMLFLGSQMIVKAESSSWNWGFEEGDIFYYHSSGTGSSEEAESAWRYNEDIYAVMGAANPTPENVTRFSELLYYVPGESTFYMNGTYTGFSRAFTHAIAISNWTKSTALLKDYLSLQYSASYNIEYIDTTASWGFRVNLTSEDPFFNDEFHWEFSKETGLTTYWLYEQIELSPGNNRTQELVMFNPLFDRIVFFGLPIGVASVILIAVVLFYRRR